MRSLFLVVPIPLFALLAALLPACSGSSSDAPPDDTCGFIADPNNCYRTLLAAVSDCLSDDTADGGIASGTLAADGTSCTYATGRTVTFGGDARQYDASKTPLDVTVAVGGKTCVHYASQPKSSLTITQPDGRVLSVAVAGLGETITCPDGSQHGIDAQKLFGGCGDAGAIFSGGLPGTITGGGGSSVSGSLVGLTKQAYSCKTP
jgi:hypothetical protein